MSAPEGQTDGFRILIVGQTGDGKSTVIRALLPNGYNGILPKTDISARGVTKTITQYPTCLGSDTYIFDCPGVGDSDAKLSHIIAGIEKAVENVPIHCVLLTNAIPNRRIVIGSQIAAAILQKGLVQNDGNALNRMIVVGTQSDTVKPRIVESWKNLIAPAFADRLGGQPRCVVTTGLEKSADGEGKDDIKELINSLKEVYEEHSVHNIRLNYHAPDAIDLVNFMNDCTGLELASAEQMQNMVAELEHTRIEYQQRLEQMVADHMKDVNNLTENMNTMQQKHLESNENMMKDMMQISRDNQAALLEIIKNPPQVVVEKGGSDCSIM